MGNQTIRLADPEDRNRMMAGESVDPYRVYFRCVPSLSVDDSGPHSWINRTLFLGTGEHLAGGVRIEVFRVR